MANTTDGRQHNRPSHEASVKGGQHSHQNQYTQSAPSESGSSSRGTRNAPSHEASVKGGQHSHTGSKSDR